MSSTQIVEQESAVFMPAMKPKVKKTIKPNPLKGVIIDDDLQEEVVKEKTLEEMKKQMEELTLAIKDKENKTIAPAYREALIVGTRNEIQELNKRREENAKIGREIASALGEKTDLLKELPDMTDTFLIDLVLDDTHFKNLCGIEVIKKAVKASSSSSAEPTNRSKLIAERKEQWKVIPQGTKLQMTYNKSGLIYTKIGETLVSDADGKVYNSMNDAIKKYIEDRGDNKTFGSAWKLFKVYDE